jgi:hypothetical protein
MIIGGNPWSSNFVMYIRSSRSIEVNCEANVEHDTMECNHYVIIL